MLLNVGSGGGAAAAPSGGAAGGATADAPVEAKEEEKKEEGMTITFGDGSTMSIRTNECFICREGRVRRGYGFRSIRLDVVVSPSPWLFPLFWRRHVFAVAMICLSLLHIQTQIRMKTSKAMSRFYVDIYRD